MRFNLRFFVGLTSCLVALQLLCGCSLAQSIGSAKNGLPVAGTTITEISPPPAKTTEGKLIEIDVVSVSPDGGVVCLSPQREPKTKSPDGSFRAVRTFYIWQSKSGIKETSEDSPNIKQGYAASGALGKILGTAEGEMNLHAADWEAKLGNKSSKPKGLAIADAVTPDGSLAGGRYLFNGDATTRKFVGGILYREDTGIVDFKEWVKSVAAQGNPLNGIDNDDTHLYPRAISADGTAIVGTYNDAVFVLRNPAGFGRNGKCFGMGTDELGVNGAITTIGKGQWTVAVAEIVAPSGKATPLSPARPKIVLLPKEITVPAGVKVGAKVRVIGQDAGKGKPLTARIVELAK